jgi:hypothetical protein
MFILLVKLVRKWLKNIIYNKENNKLYILIESIFQNDSKSDWTNKLNNFSLILKNFIYIFVILFT